MRSKQNQKGTIVSKTDHYPEGFTNTNKSQIDFPTAETGVCKQEYLRLTQKRKNFSK